MKWIYLIFIFVLAACQPQSEADKAKQPTYVPPTIDRNGRFRKGYVKQPISLSKHAVKRQNSSKYYYKTRGKYTKRAKKK